MNRRGKNRRCGRKPKAENAASRDEREDELQRLRDKVDADAKLLAVLAADASSSLEIPALVETVRERYEQALLETCTLLEERLGEAETRVAELERENRRLTDANKSLKYSKDRLALQLKRALGVKASTEGGDDQRQDRTGEKPLPDKKPRDGGRRGAPKGHAGRTRPVPDKIDREQVIPPPDTCACGCSQVMPLSDCDTRYVEDIPPVSREVIRQIYLRGRCGNCGKVVRHPDADNGPPVTTGPNLAAHLAMMNQMGVTFRKLSSFSTRVLGIELSPSGALGIVQRVVASLEGPYGQIQRCLPEQDWLNGDETGWKVAGRNGYIWCFCNTDVAFFHHDYRRGAKVIEEILGDTFRGIVVCDFYAAYNCVGHTQRCLVHLLRDIKTEREILHGSKLLENFEKQVKEFIEKGLEVQAMPEGPRKDKAMKKLEKRLDRLTRMKVTKGKATTLVKRINRYRDDIIRFVTHPGVEFHNNRAERQLRPIVVNRKVSFGSNTDHGARRYCIIHTIVETCKLQRIDPTNFIRRAYMSGGLDVPLLAGADPPESEAA